MVETLGESTDVLRGFVYCKTYCKPLVIPSLLSDGFDRLFYSAIPSQRAHNTAVVDLWHTTAYHICNMAFSSLLSLFLRAVNVAPFYGTILLTTSPGTEPSTLVTLDFSSGLSDIHVGAD